MSASGLLIPTPARKEHPSKFEAVAAAISDLPASNSAEAWLRTTAGVVAILLCLQMFTGLLLAFYYVPSSDAAYTTIEFVEKIVPSGAWIRSLHHYGSQWLSVALLLHIGQMLWRESYLRKPVGWLAAIVILGLVFAAGATGYSLPWDERAFIATRITENVAGRLPVVGSNLREWILGSRHISPATLARFFAVHALVLPSFTLFVLAIRLSISRGSAGAQQETSTQIDRDWLRTQLSRNMISAGSVFIALSFFALRYHAPLGPAVGAADANYLPRPGPQFLWLFEMLKLLPGSLASLAGTIFPGAVILALASLPILGERVSRKSNKIIPGLYLAVLCIIAGLTAIAYRQDFADQRVHDQLGLQTQEEKNFLAEPFQPRRILTTEEIESAAAAPSLQPNSNTQAAPAKGDPPQSYVTNCAQCHGFRGEGTALFPKLLGVSQKTRRTPDDLLRLLDDPVAYGLKPPMKSFAGKLTDQEKQEIVNWVTALPSKKR